MKRLFFGFVIANFFAASCVYHDTVAPVDCTKSGLSLSLDSIRSATSCSVLDGAIYVTGVGGVSPLRYRVNDLYFSHGAITGLSTGIYTVFVVDDNGCEALIGNVNIPADGTVLLPTFEEDTECFEDNGSVTLTIVEGNRPYEFNIDSGPFSNDTVFNGLSHGSHLVKARDADGCEVDLNVTVPRGRTSVSWTTDIKPLFTTYCATTGCHNGISRTTDFRKIRSAQKFAKEIKELTGNRKMPFDETLTQHQIDVIACWVDDGALEN